MSLVYVLVPAALGLGLVFLFGFIWATRDGQYDDLDSPPQRILLDSEKEQRANE